MNSNNENHGNRWLIAAAAVVMQLCLGTIYAWSVFIKPLMAAHSWNETSVQVAFMLCIGSNGLAAAFAGALIDRKGPRFVATMGGVFFGIGTLLAGLADHIGSLWLLYFGFGLIGGVGTGFGYVTPIATLIRWFPDRRGLVTGLAVMGFGGGAFIMGMIAPRMVGAMGVAQTFFIFGVIFLVVVPAAAQFYKNPPPDWLPSGFKPKADTVSLTSSFTCGEAVRTPQWWMLWGMLFLNISAGIGLLSQLSPLAQDVIRKKSTGISPQDLAVAGGTIVAVAAVFNGLGRLLWAWISDALGRRNVFLIMFATQAILYLCLPLVGVEIFFTIMACYLLACYGGGFAVMPAFVADTFGPAHIGRIYGIMLAAWGAAGIVGPLIFSQIKGIALYVAAGMLMAGFVLALFYKRPERREI